MENAHATLLSRGRIIDRKWILSSCRGTRGDVLANGVSQGAELYIDKTRETIDLKRRMAK
jgi:hypothetical protein